MKVRANPKVFMMLAAVALVGGMIGSYFQWSSLQEQVAKADQLRKQMLDESETRQQLEASTKKLTDTAEKLSHLEKGVPQFAYVPTMLKELDQIGTDNGLVVLGVRPVIQSATSSQVAKSANAEGETKKRKPYQELNIEVKGRGNYRSVLNFVQALKAFPKIVAARTISLTPKQATGPEGTLDVVIELRAYLFPMAQPAQSRMPDKVEAKRKEGPNNNG